MRFTRAIVCPPASSFAQGLTTSDLGVPFYELALEQHEQYCLALERCGLSLTRLPADPDHPDSTFVEDTAVLTSRGAMLARPGAESRASEVTNVRGILAECYRELSQIEAPGTLDGGDVCDADGHFLIGISERTNPDGARQMAAWLERQGYTSAYIDIRGFASLLHLKAGLSYLGQGRMAAVEALAGDVELRRYHVLRVPSGEEYAANCVNANGPVLVPAGHPAFGAKLREAGLPVVELNVSEFRKMDGGVSCLSIRF